MKTHPHHSELAVNRLTQLGAIGMVPLLGACSTLSSSTGIGSVSDAGGANLRLCFPSGATPPSGQEVDIMRRESVGSLRPPFTYVDRKVGVARITATPAGSDCVAAELVDGKAQRSDAVNWLRVGTER